MYLLSYFSSESSILNRGMSHKNLIQHEGGPIQDNVAIANFMLVEKKVRRTIPTAWHRPVSVTGNKGFPCAKGVLGYGNFTGSKHLSGMSQAQTTFSSISFLILLSLYIMIFIFKAQAFWQTSTPLLCVKHTFMTMLLNPHIQSSLLQ